MNCPPHHFRLTTPNGPTVDGVCIKCGMQKTYPAGERQWNEKVTGAAAQSRKAKR